MLNTYVPYAFNSTFVPKISFLKYWCKLFDQILRILTPKPELLIGNQIPTFDISLHILVPGIDNVFDKFFLVKRNIIELAKL